MLCYEHVPSNEDVKRIELAQYDVEWLVCYSSVLVGNAGCLTLRRLMSYIYIYIYIYIYGAPILDVSRSHTTTQHSR